MRLPTPLLTLLSALPTTIHAATLILSIPPSPLLPNPSILPPSTHATLFGASAHLSAPLSRSNTFTFLNLTTNSYLLNIHSRDHVFAPLRVDVSTPLVPGTDDKGTATQKPAELGQELVEVWQTFRGNEWDNKGELRGRGEGMVVVEVVPIRVKEYYEERQGFSVLAFLKSPMILMALFSTALIFGMPYLMENMDEETRAEIEEMQKKSPAANPAASIQNFDLASWMAGKPSKSGAAEEKREGTRSR